MRADVYIFNTGQAKSRSSARTLIVAGAVTVDGKTVEKPSEEIDPETEHSICITESEKFVSRGGLKLETALEAFGIDVTGYFALDIGASTGGFTDCLLSRGAASVVAVDSGEGQLAPKIAADVRVKNIEKYNARSLSRDIIPDGADIAVMDVSFISQTLILPRIPLILRPGGKLISLIKPQFEAGRAAVGKGGIVKNRNDRYKAVLRVRNSALDAGLFMTRLIRSPITGGDGNTEFLALFESAGKALADNEVKRTATE